MSLRSILRKLHFIDPFDDDDIDKAEAENAMHDHDKTMGRLETASLGIRAAQGKLKESIEISRTSSDSARRPDDKIALLIHDMRSSSHAQRN